MPAQPLSGNIQSPINIVWIVWQTNEGGKRVRSREAVGLKNFRKYINIFGEDDLFFY